MPNPIKYTAGTETQALKKGNFYIGTRDVAKGPTSATGYYAGITPPTNGYTIYLNKASSGPSIYVATGATDLITITNRIAGANYTTSGECLNYFATQTDKMVFNRDYESIITSGLTFNVDAGFTPSYPTTGTTIYDITFSGNNGTLTNGPVFSSISGGSISFDGSDDYASFASYPYLVNNLTLSFWFKTSVIPTGYKGVVTTWTPSAPNSSSYGVQFKNDGTLEPVRPVGSNWNVITSTTNTTNNNWTNCSVVYNTSGTFLYINGSLDNSNAVGSNMNPPLGFRLGSSITNNFNWNGSLSNVQIYNRALSSSEVLQNYQSTFTRFLGENIVGNGLALYLDAGYYPSYSGTGTNWADISGNRNNGTLTNGPTFSGGSIVFDGIDDYVNCGNISASILSNNQFSVSFWFIMTGTARVDLFNIKNFNSPSDDIGFFIDTDNKLYAYFAIKGVVTNNSVGFGYASVSRTTFSRNKLYHITCIKDSSQKIVMYVNGVFDNNTYSTVTNTSNVATTPLWIGSNKTTITSPSFPFRGNIFITQVYNKGITPFDVYQNYNAQKSRFGIPDIVTNGLVLNLDAGNPYSYNPLNTGSTRWIDVTNSTTGGTLVNGTYYSGGTMIFDYVDDYVRVAPVNLNVNSFSCESFFQWSNLGTNRGTIFSLNYDYPNSGYLIRQRDDGSGKFVIWSDYGSETGIFSTSALTINTWYHVVVVQNNNNCSIYINGVLDSSQSLPNPVLNQNFPILFGVRALSGPSAGAYFPGKIGVNKIYNRDLSAQEVLQNYNALKERYGL